MVFRLAAVPVTFGVRGVTKIVLLIAVEPDNPARETQMAVVALVSIIFGLVVVRFTPYATWGSGRNDGRQPYEMIEPDNADDENEPDGDVAWGIPNDPTGRV